jgi:nucleoside-diphosphate-sugar epimerase
LIYSEAIEACVVAAEQLSTTHWYDMAPARRDFGYAPRVSIDDGLARLASAYRG